MACLFLSELPVRSARISRFGGGGLRPSMLRTFLAEIIFDLDFHGVRSCRLCPLRDCAWKVDHQSQSLRCLLADSDILWSEDFRYLLEFQASHWSSARPCLGMKEFPIVCAGSAVIYQFSFFWSERHRIMHKVFQMNTIQFLGFLFSRIEIVWPSLSSTQIENIYDCVHHSIAPKLEEDSCEESASLPVQHQVPDIK